MNLRKTHTDGHKSRCTIRLLVICWLLSAVVELCVNSSGGSLHSVVGQVVLSSLEQCHGSWNRAVCLSKRIQRPL